MSSSEDERVSEVYKYNVTSALISTDRQRNGASKGALDVPGDAAVVQGAQATSPETTLTAFCQLAAIRLGVQRVGISLISSHQQYILAESTRTTNLADTSKSDLAEDSLWLGMTECSRFGNLCENTVALPPAKDAGTAPPCFTVLDLRKSPFRSAPYVTGPLAMKFYCGTPVTTPKDLNIGSLWVLDNRLFPEFSNEQKCFFGTMAGLVFKHLEMTMESLERAKVMRMGQALSDFVDGSSPLEHVRRPRHAGSFDQSNRSSVIGTNTPMIGGEEDGNDLAKETANMTLSPSPTQATESRAKTWEKPPRQEPSIDTVEHTEHLSSISRPDRNGEEEKSDIFARASYFIKDALDISGCVFLDTALGSLTGADAVTQDTDDRDAERQSQATRDWVNAGNEVSAGSQRRRRSLQGLLAAPAIQKATVTETLGFAVGGLTSLAGDQPSELSVLPVEDEFMLDLARRYTHGTLWSFEDGGAFFPPGDHVPSGNNSNFRGVGRKSNKARRRNEAHILQKHFPGVRQLLFMPVPLFDSALGQAAAGFFAFSTSNPRAFTAESDLPWVKSMINNIAAEVSRLDALALSSSKSDFIGSISHELRSPLHGILAAAEFLTDTHLDSYQKSLISTQVSCGKTLLQVIEHVLDYSKINSLEKDERTARRNGSDVGSERLNFGPKMQNLFEQTDICELAEEVVEGSVAGKAHVASTITVDSLGPRINGASKKDSSAIYGFMKNVAVILDFDYQKDWVYITQPGAIRRIIMNILGNSLKYTASGCIRVRLGIYAAEDLAGGADSHDTISLQIQDTGKGISREFLRKRLFQPFNQESSLSSGCGLGLSIVKSLIITLNGTLEVRSEQGVGTTVTCNIPLLRGNRKMNGEDHSPASAGDFRSTGHLPGSGTTVGFVGFVILEAVDDHTITHREAKIKENIKASVTNCMVDWLQMRPIERDSELDDADYVVVLVDDKLGSFLQPYIDDMARKQPRVIALLASEMSRRDVEKTLGQTIRAFEVISAPFGPRKMARAVAVCEKTAERASWRPTPMPCQENPFNDLQKDMKIGGNLLAANGISSSPHHNSEESEQRKTSSTPAEIASKYVPQISVVAAEAGAEVDERDRPSYIRQQSKFESPQSSEFNSQDNSATQSRSPSVQPQDKHNRLLLVDDNAINLKFLETYVKKRHPPVPYDLAENGLQAVEAAQGRDTGYTIIFMDLSMPVMDGLEATRKIRGLEKERKERLGDISPAPALVVALTGLASGRDQANAFASGIDMFLTKPVRFKDIGKLLDERITT